jgi:hypothetical protein
MKINWTGNFSIKTEFDKDKKEGNSFYIIANKDGLLSLANILTDMANDEIYSGWHLHLDEWSGLEKGSVELTLMKE